MAKDDIPPIVQLAENPGVYYIPYPNKTAFVQIRVAFAITDKLLKHETPARRFALMHFLEHYFSGVYRKEQTRSFFVNASTNPESLELYFKSRPEKLIEDCVFIFEKLKEELGSETLLDREKKSIFEEYLQRLEDPKGKTGERMVQERTNPECLYNIPSQKLLEETKDITLQELNTFASLFLKETYPYVMVGGYELSSDVQYELAEKIKELWPEQQNSPELSKQLCQYSERKIVYEDPTSLDEDHMRINISFPGYRTGEDISKRLALNIMLHIFCTDSYYGIRQSIRNAGIYGVHYTTRFHRLGGVYFLSGYLHKENLEALLKIINEEIINIRKKGLPVEILEEFVDAVNEDAQERWAQNSARFSGFSDDLIDRKEIESAEDIEKGVSKITPEYIKKVAREVFTPEKMNVVILGKDLPLSREKIDSLLSLK